MLVKLPEGGEPPTGTQKNPAPAGAVGKVPTF
jgi:hypothetical protein